MKNSFDSIRALAYNMMQRVRSRAVQYPAAQTMGESEAGQCNIPLRKLWVACSDGVTDRCLRTVGLIVRLPQTSVVTQPDTISP